MFEGPDQGDQNAAEFPPRLPMEVADAIAESKDELPSEANIPSNESITGQEMMAALPQPDQLIEQARKELAEAGFEVDEGGLLKIDGASPEQEAFLRDRAAAKRELGLVMSDPDSFAENILLACSIWRQRNGEGGLDYVIGKGVGAELAFHGNVRGREKRLPTASFRSHLDLDLYGIGRGYGPDGIAAEKVPSLFEPSLSMVEFFPEDRTKRFTGIPPGFITQHAEAIDYGGITVYVPELEFIFLDKFTTGEVSTRPEGKDYELLARMYKLDPEKIHRYIDDLVVQGRCRDPKLGRQELANFNSDISSLASHILSTRTERVDGPTLTNMIQDYVAGRLVPGVTTTQRPGKLTHLILERESFAVDAKGKVISPTDEEIREAARELARMDIIEAGERDKQRVTEILQAAERERAPH